MSPDIVSANRERERTRAREAGLAAVAVSRGAALLLAGALLWMFVQSLPSRAIGLQPQHAHLRLNPNTASKPELMLLPGIGPALADNIIAYRQSAAGVAFSTADDLDQVYRIGPVTVERLRHMLMFDPPEDAPR